MAVLLGLAVAVPALVLAGLGIYLSIRISRAVEAESTRYNTYLGQQVVQAFEQELLAHLRRGILTAENVARLGGRQADVMVALESGTQEFEGAHFVPLDELNGYSLLIVESQPLVYAPAEGARRGQYFAGVLLRDGENQVMGAGGWWISPHKFLIQHLSDVVQERLPANPRLYGGYESTRKLSVEIGDAQGAPIARIREPSSASTSHLEHFAGPFEGYTARVAATWASPVAWTGRFVAIEITFIGLLGLVLVTATIFGLRYTVRQLELAQLKASFVSNVTHELKTPIAMIRLAVETLEMRRVNTPEEADRFLQTIGRETGRLSSLVDNILDFARLEAGQHIFQFEDVDLGRVVEEAVDSLRLRLEHLGFTVAVEIPDDLPLVRGDRNALTHCVLNLLDNAVKYSRARKELRVVVAPRTDAVTVAVTDRGIGIAPGDQKRIFEKFVRLETGLVHDVKGAGLGLSLVDQIIRAHQGRIEVMSAPGEGSTFTIVLPIAGEVAAQGQEPRRKTAS